MTLAASRRRFTIEEYHRMGEAGILADDPRIELIGGTIVVREPTGAKQPLSAHSGGSAAVDHVDRRGLEADGDRAAYLQRELEHGVAGDQRHEQLIAIDEHAHLRSDRDQLRDLP